MRQIVDRQNGFCFHEGRQHILSVENVRLCLGKQARENGTNPGEGIFGDWSKVKGRVSNTFLVSSGWIGIKKFVLIRSRGLRKPAQQLAAICFIAPGLGA